MRLQTRSVLLASGVTKEPVVSSVARRWRNTRNQIRVETVLDLDKLSRLRRKMGLKDVRSINLRPLSRFLSRGGADASGSRI